MSWRLVSPAPRSAVLDLAPAPARVRRLLLAQSRIAETVVVYRDDEPIAAMMFSNRRRGRTEVAFVSRPEAASHIGRLARMAQLTLLQMAETRVVFARVSPANRAGQRLASIVGFRPLGKRLWIFRSDRHGISIRRQ